MPIWDYGIDTIKALSDQITNLQDLVVDSDISILGAAIAPMASGLLSGKLPRRNLNAMSVRHFEDRPDPWVFSIAADAAVGATDLNIKDSAASFQDGTILFIPETFEQIMLTATPDADLSTNTPYERGRGSQAKAVTAGMTVINMGRVGDEKEGAPDARMTTPQERVFYPTVMDDYVVETTLFEDIQKTKHGSERLYQQKKKMQKLMLDFEHRCFFSRGGSNITAQSGEVRPQLTGVLDWILDYGSNFVKMETLTYGDLENFLKGPSRYHKGDYAMYAGGKVMQIINSWGRDYLQIHQSETFFGMQIQYIQTTYGKIFLFMEPWWSEGDLNGYIFIIPLPINDHIQLWTASPEDTGNKRIKTGEITWYFDIEKENNRRYTKDQLMCIKGTELWDAEKMGFIYGVQA